MPPVTRPYTFHGNTPAIADEVNANFNTLFELVNGNLDEANLKPATVDDNLIPTSNSNTLWRLFSWIANRIKAITGQPTWRDSPPITLKAVSDHVNNKNNPHGVTAEQVGAVPVSTFNNHHHDGRYARAMNGAKNIWVQASQPTTGVSDGDIWIRA